MSSALGHAGTIFGISTGAAGLIITGIVSAISIAIPVIDHFVVTADEARDNFEDLNDTLEKHKTTLESLQDEYDSNIEKLKEYQSLKTEDLTDVD